MRNRSTLIRNVIYISTLYECSESLLNFINFFLMVTKIRPSETESNSYEFLEKCKIVQTLHLAVIFFLILTIFTRIAYLWTFGRSNPGGGEIFDTTLDRLWSPPSLLCNWHHIILWGKAAGSWR